jgi:hypothetical protein
MAEDVLDGLGILDVTDVVHLRAAASTKSYGGSTISLCSVS